jgi:hypothetical protein
MQTPACRDRNNVVPPLRSLAGWCCRPPPMNALDPEAVSPKRAEERTSTVRVLHKASAHQTSEGVLSHTPDSEQLARRCPHGHVVAGVEMHGRLREHGVVFKLGPSQWRTVGGNENELGCGWERACQQRFAGGLRTRKRGYI